MTPYQPLEEPPSSSPISLGLEIDINYITILIHSPPKVVLLALDLHEDFIDVECIAVSSVLSLQSSGGYRTKLDEPQADCLSADGNTSLCQEALDIAMTEVESIVKPDSVGNDVRWGAPSWNR
jgi:hypothetical protein